MAKSNTNQSPKLNDKQKLFCQEYLIDFNATQAAIRAGYSEKTARQIAAENLSKPYIHDYIQLLVKERSERTQITADRVLKEVANIAFGNMRDFAEFGPDGIVFKKSKDLPAEKMALISELSCESKEFNGVTTVNTKFKLYAKDTALYTLMRHLGMFEKDNRQQGKAIKVVIKKK